METLYIILLVALGVINIISLVHDDYIFDIKAELISALTSTGIFILVVFVPDLQIESIKYQTIVYCITIVLFVISWLSLLYELNK